MCSGSGAGSHLRLMDFVYHSTVVLRVMSKKKKKKKKGTNQQLLRGRPGCGEERERRFRLLLRGCLLGRQACPVPIVCTHQTSAPWNVTIDSLRESLLTNS